MYLDRDHGRGGIHPGSMGMAVAVSGAMIAGLMTSSPTITAWIGEPPIMIYNVPTDSPPPLPDPAPAPHSEAKTIATPRVDTTTALDPTPADPGLALVPGPIAVDFGADTGLGTGAGTGPIAIDPPKPPPVLVQPGVDPRYARDLQPVYPAGERRAGHEGKVVVRALIGTDGRVKRIERISAASDAFWRATEERALGKWRFTPGTRDGVPVEAWRTMTLSFVIED